MLLRVRVAAEKHGGPADLAGGALLDDGRGLPLASQHHDGDSYAPPDRSDEDEDATEDLDDGGGSAGGGEKEILGSDDDEQEDPKDYCKGKI